MYFEISKRLLWIFVQSLFPIKGAILRDNLESYLANTDCYAISCCILFTTSKVYFMKQSSFFANPQPRFCSAFHPCNVKNSLSKLLCQLWIIYREIIDAKFHESERKLNEWTLSQRQSYIQLSALFYNMNYTKCRYTKNIF